MITVPVDLRMEYEASRYIPGQGPLEYSIVNVIHYQGSADNSEEEIGLETGASVAFFAYGPSMTCDFCEFFSLSMMNRRGRGIVWVNVFQVFYVEP